MDIFRKLSSRMSRLISGIPETEPAVLSDITIKKMVDKGQLIENGIKDFQVQPNSIDLTVGPTVKKLRPNSKMKIANDLYEIIDPTREIKYESLEFEPIELDTISIDLSPIEDVSTVRYYRLDPQEFVLMASNEILNIPNGILSFVQGRSSVARLAIQTEQAGLIDAGFRGTITFEVFNQSDYPIIIFEGMRIAQVYFFRAEKAEKLYGLEKLSKYKGQIEATGSMIHKDVRK